MAGSEVLLTYKRKRFRSARCSIDSASVDVNRLGESAEGNNIERCTDVSEPDPEQKRVCSGIVKLQPSLSSPKVIKEEDKSNPVHESDCMTCDPSEVQDESLVEGRSKKASCDPVSLLGEGVSNTIKGGSCSASLQKSDKMCPEGTVVTAEGMLADMDPKNKLNLPMKTFCRRSKQKRHSETLENDSTLPVTGDCLLTTGVYKSTDTLSSCEATASKLCSLNALKDPCFPKMNLTSEPALTQSQEKKAAAEVESSCGGSCSTFQNGSNSKLVDVTLGNTSGVVQSHGTGSSQNFGLTFSSLQAMNGVDFQEIPSAKVISSKKALKQEVQGGPIIGSSLPSINGNLNPPIPPVPNKDLLLPKLETANTNSTHQVNHWSSARAIGEKASQINFAPALNHTCLQLFPENVSDQRNYWQEARAHAVSEERPINLHQIRTQARTATPLSSRYLGLPLEPRLKNLACNPGLSLQQSLGMQSMGLIPETKLQHLPDQMSSFTRHQTILDQIAARANSLKGIRSNHLEKNDNGLTLWSEEELDSLWIGVRRYERGNWDAMLRDPRLHFMPWRAPAELAVQWEKEQLKLLNHITFCNQRQSNALNVVRDCSGSYIHPRTGKHISADEVRSSLGDVCSEPRELFLKRLRYLSAQNDGRKQVQESVADLNSMYLSLANQRRAMLEMHAARGVNSRFPHWLNQVGVLPPRTNDTALHAILSTVNHGDIRFANQRGVNSSGESISAPSTVVQNSNATQPGNCQGAPSVDEGEKVKDNEPNNNTMNKEEVITINSDTSSEETVSDDQSGRP